MFLNLKLITHNPGFKIRLRSLECVPCKLLYAAMQLVRKITGVNRRRCYFWTVTLVFVFNQAVGLLLLLYVVPDPIDVENGGTASRRVCRATGRQAGRLVTARDSRVHRHRVDDGQRPRWNAHTPRTCWLCYLMCLCCDVDSRHADILRPFSRVYTRTTSDVNTPTALTSSSPGTRPPHSRPPACCLPGRYVGPRRRRLITRLPHHTSHVTDQCRV